MANRYKLTVQAIEDLGGIWNYTFDNWSEAQAEKYYQLLLKQCQEVADGKVFGKKYAEILDGLYGAAAGQHIIFYRFLDGSTIEIIRIQHSRMDLKSKFDG